MDYHSTGTCGLPRYRALQRGGGWVAPGHQHNGTTRCPEPTTHDGGTRQKRRSRARV